MSVLNGLRAERLIAKRYEERGYTVTIAPPPSAIPFSLGSYRPDILATKGTENLLIEVKSQNYRRESELYFKVDQEVQQHPGWRFMLVTVAEEELQEFGSSTSLPPTLKTIQERLEQLDRLLEVDGAAELLFPLLWVAYIAALRLLVASEGISQETLSDLSIINKAYTEGISSIDEYESGRRFLKLRNEAVHSLDLAVTTLECQQLRRMIDDVVRKIARPGR